MSIVASIVVPTRGRPELLRRCLRSLLAQDFDPAAYEIMVADDAASDHTRALVERVAVPTRVRRADSARPVAVRYVAVRGAHGPAAARNVGWRAAHGEAIAFIDDDCVAERGWLAAGVRALADGADAAWGSVRVPVAAAPTDYERDAAGLERAGFVTASCFVRRAPLAAVGGFDERFCLAWREDSDLLFSLLDRGCRVRHAPAAVVVHPVRPARWGVSLAQQRKAMYDALLYRKHPRRYRAAIRRTAPPAYYAAVLALAGAAAGALAGRHRAALLGAAVWGGVTARFCARRLAGTSCSARHVAEMVVTSALIPPLSLYWQARGAIRFRVLFV